MRNRLSRTIPIFLDARLVATKIHERNSGHSANDFTECPHADCVFAKRLIDGCKPIWISAAVVHKVGEMVQR